MKKFLCLILAVVAFIPLFSGCGEIEKYWESAYAKAKILCVDEDLTDEQREVYEIVSSMKGFDTAAVPNTDFRNVVNGTAAIKDYSEILVYNDVYVSNLRLFRENFNYLSDAPKITDEQVNKINARGIYSEFEKELDGFTNSVKKFISAKNKYLSNIANISNFDTVTQKSYVKDFKKSFSDYIGSTVNLAEKFSVLYFNCINPSKEELDAGARKDVNADTIYVMELECSRLTGNGFYNMFIKPYKGEVISGNINASATILKNSIPESAAGRKLFYEDKITQNYETANEIFKEIMQTYKYILNEKNQAEKFINEINIVFVLSGNDFTELYNGTANKTPSFDQQKAIFIITYMDKSLKEFRNLFTGI